MILPKPIIDGSYASRDEILIDTISATEYFLARENGEAYFLKWWGNGWIVNFQQSYLCKSDKQFYHKDDIASFSHSHFNDPSFQWNHVFRTIEEATECFRTRKLKKLPTDENFYRRVFDVLVGIGAEDGEYRKGFMYNYLNDTHKDHDWRFFCMSGILQGITVDYISELNEVKYKFNKTLTVEQREMIYAANGELKRLVE